MWWICKIEIWSEELIGGYQTVRYQPEALFWGGQLSVVFSTQFNPYNSLLKLRQISLLFMCTSALTEGGAEDSVT